MGPFLDFLEGGIPRCRRKGHVGSRGGGGGSLKPTVTVMRNGQKDDP